MTLDEAEKAVLSIGEAEKAILSTGEAKASVVENNDAVPDLEVFLQPSLQLSAHPPLQAEHPASLQSPASSSAVAAGLMEAMPPLNSFCSLGVSSDSNFFIVI